MNFSHSPYNLECEDKDQELEKVKGKYFFLGKLYKHTKYLTRQSHQIIQHTQVSWRKKGQREWRIYRTPGRLLKCREKQGLNDPGTVEYCWSKWDQRQWLNYVEEWHWTHARCTVKLQLGGQQSINAYEDHPLSHARQELLFLLVPQELVSGTIFYFFFTERRRLFSAGLNWEAQVTSADFIQQNNCDCSPSLYATHYNPTVLMLRNLRPKEN